MAILKAFTEKLKSLRGSLEVTRLAKEKGTSVPTIYKAEGGEQNVKWQTIEDIYGDLCKSDYEFMDLLMLWALGQTDRKLDISQARESMMAMAVKEEQARSKEAEALLKEAEMMSVPEQREFLTFAKHFRRSQHTRRMAAVWVESSDEWIREMER